MNKVWEANAIGTAPPYPTTPSIGDPTDGDLGTSTPATNPGAWWFHMITMELLNVITAAGLTPNGTSVTQLLAALDARYGAAIAAAAASSLGMGQTWADVTGSRAIGTVYTNTSARAIAVAVSSSATNSQSALYVNGVLVATGTNIGGTWANTAFAIVPPGATYEVLNPIGGTPNFSSWVEMR